MLILWEEKGDCATIVRHRPDMERTDEDDFIRKSLVTHADLMLLEIRLGLFQREIQILYTEMSSSKRKHTTLPTCSRRFLLRLVVSVVGLQCTHEQCRRDTQTFISEEYPAF